MKVKVKKFLFLGSKTAHEAFFERAQRIGWFEFISVSGQKPHHLPKPIEDLKLAIKILKKQQVKEVQTEAEEYRAPCIAEQVLYAKSELERLTEARRLLQAEMVKIHPLGEFDLNEIALLEKETHRVFQFVFTRHDRLTRDEIPKDLIFIKREFDFDYYLYIGVERFFHQAFTEVFVRTSLSKIVQEHKEIDQALHEKERQLRELTTYQQFLEEFFLREMSRLDLTFAKGDVDYYLEEGIFGIEAWVPENKLQAIPMIIEGLPIHVSEVVIETEDVVPTYLENRGLSRVGQDLVEIYDTPSITDKDPSTWILIAFSLFFGMIISDAGYGLIFLCASLYGWWRFPGLKGVKRRMLTLATCLASSSLIWGVLIASYFGLRFDPESPLYKVSILHQLALHKVGYHMQHQDATYYEWVKEYPAIADAKTPMAVMYAGVRHGEYTFMNELSEGLFVEVAILVGLLHLSLSFLRNVYRDWSGIGWTVTLWGGYLFFPTVAGAVSLVQYLHILPPSSSVVGQQLIYVGLGLACVLALIQKGASGMTAIFKIIELFADALSYLRLYALGLASMVMASTFNEMAALVGGGLFGGMILLFGHTINITLGLMAGTLHGLRLNFLEWYHHCFEGDGKPFRPLMLFSKGD